MLCRCDESLQLLAHHIVIMCQGNEVRAAIDGRHHSDGLIEALVDPRLVGKSSLRLV